MSDGTFKANCPSIFVTSPFFVPSITIEAPIKGSLSSPPITIPRTTTGDAQPSERSTTFTSPFLAVRTGRLEVLSGLTPCAAAVIGITVAQIPAAIPATFIPNPLPLRAFNSRSR